ncbi:hypothetical protein JRQ81_019253 [Phrynocephalus forsythii]|uniref:BACK domain-containing protein n=1 Tax=Phrynocephalus forsythii TaxID=171643 RepID=A0A9Q0XNJ9_9SAUR|nr:hypothetical protein JRQ81_019253 [Phrynocephalus forsythii]
MKEESSFGTKGPDQKAALHQRNRRHPEKLRNTSCHADRMLRTLNVYRREGNLTDVVLKSDGKSLSLALDYMYGEKVAIRPDNAPGLLELSHVLQIPKLRVACATILEGHLSLGNCLPLLKLATSFSLSSLAGKSKLLVLGGFAEVSRHKQFLEMDAQTLEGCLSSERLAVPNEAVVFEAVMRWVRHDLPARKEVLGDLLGHVRLPLLDPVYFLEKVESEELIWGSPACLPWLREARRSYILGADVSSPRLRPRRFMEVAEMIAVIGGCDKNGLLQLPFVDLFHPTSRQWKPLPSLPGYTKSEFAVCTLKNDIYLSGGHINSRDVWLLSSRLNVWIKVARLQKGRWRHKMATLHGKIYAVGGYDGVHRLASVECYDPFSNRWASLPPLPEAVSSAAVAPCLSKIYVIGGAVGGGTSTSKVQCYNPEENTWSLLSPSPFSQRCIEAVTLDGSIYVAGGLLSQIFCYNPQSDTWTKAASLPGPLESCGVTACGGKIYILGGRNEQAEGTDQVYALDTATGKVEPQPPLRRCTSYHGCVTILRHTNQ